MKLMTVVVLLAAAIGVGGYFGVAALEAKAETAIVIRSYVPPPAEPPQPPRAGLPNLFSGDAYEHSGGFSWENALRYVPGAIAALFVALLLIWRIPRLHRPGAHS